MKKLFVRDLGIYGISTLVVRFINYILIPVYARILSPEEYGVIDLLTVLTYLAGIILFQELYQAIARYFVGSSFSEKSDMVSTVTTFYFIVYFPLTFLVFATADQISLLLFQTVDRAPVIFWAFVATFVNALLNLFQHVLRYSLQSFRYSLVNVLWVLGTVSFTVWFVVIERVGIIGVYFGQIGGGLLGLGLVIAMIWPYFNLSVRWQVLRPLLKFSHPLIYAALLLYLMTYTDRWLIKEYLGVYNVGIYGMIYKIAAIPMMLINIVSTSLLPHIYKVYGDVREYKDVALIYTAVFLWGGFLVATLGLFQELIVGLVAGEQYAPFSSLFSYILMGGFFLHFSFMFVGTYLKAKTGIAAYIYAFGWIISVIANLLLIPRFGLNGVAASCLLTATIILVLQWYFSQANFRLPIKVSPLLVQLFCILFPLFLYHYFLYNGIFVHFVFKACLVVTSFLLTIYFYKKAVDQSTEIIPLNS